LLFGYSRCHTNIFVFSEREEEEEESGTEDELLSSFKANGLYILSYEPIK
jgi:hypothetical protein